MIMTALCLCHIVLTATIDQWPYQRRINDSFQTVPSLLPETSIIIPESQHLHLSLNTEYPGKIAGTYHPIPSAGRDSGRGSTFPGYHYPLNQLLAIERGPIAIFTFNIFRNGMEWNEGMDGSGME